MEDDDFEIFPENWDAVQVYLACQTQWIVGGMDGSIVGLNYQSVELVMRLKECQNFDTLQRVQVMESEMLDLFRKKRNARSNKASNSHRR